MRKHFSLAASHYFESNSLTSLACQHTQVTKLLILLFQVSIPPWPAGTKLIKKIGIFLIIIAHSLCFSLSHSFSNFFPFLFLSLLSFCLSLFQRLEVLSDPSFQITFNKLRSVGQILLFPDWARETGLLSKVSEMTVAVCARTRSANFWLLLKVVKCNGKIQTNQSKSKTGSQETESLVLVEVLTCCVTLGRPQHLSESAISHLPFEGTAADKPWVSSLSVEPLRGAEDRLSLSLYSFPFSQSTPEILTFLQGSRHAFLGGFDGPWSLIQQLACACTVFCNLVIFPLKFRVGISRMWSLNSTGYYF